MKVLRYLVPFATMLLIAHIESSDHEYLRQVSLLYSLKDDPAYGPT